MSPTTPTVNLCWFRRDLRLLDHAALYHALKSENPVVPVFVFDTNVLQELADKHDRRITFIHGILEDIQEKLGNLGATLDVYYGTPEEAFAYWTEQYDVKAVFTNTAYEPYTREKDAAIADMLKEKAITFHQYKDQVIFDANEILDDNGEPYTVFSEYSKKWTSSLNDFHVRFYPAENYFGNFFKQKKKKVPSLRAIGFVAGRRAFPSIYVKDSLIQQYDETYDHPGIEGTTHLGLHLRFGTVSIRELAARAKALNETFLGELIRRDFFQAMLWHFPHVAEHAFRREYDGISWRNNEEEFKRWCEGETGYPIVDAGMRELNETGFMHHRVRMITAVFLTRYLLIDWRWGAAYFAQHLLDYDLAANNGNWQLAAGCGYDTTSYAEVFNPLKAQEIDASFAYVRKWVTEFETAAYTAPIVVDEELRKQVLEVQQDALISL